MNDEPAAAIRLNDPTALLGVIPGVLGFHPTDSLVAAFFDRQTHQMGPVARMDLPLPDEAIPDLVAFGYRHGDQVFLASYSDGDQHHDNVETVAAALDEYLDVLAVIFTGNDHAPVNSDMLAACAFGGRAVLHDREELASTVEHIQGRDPEVPYDLTTVHHRDRLIGQALQAPGDYLVPLLDAARSVPDGDPRCATVCLVLSLVAYRTGDGALAQVALARSRRVEPGNQLAALTGQLYNTGITPEALADLATTLAVPVPEPVQQDGTTGR